MIDKIISNYKVRANYDGMNTKDYYTNIRKDMFRRYLHRSPTREQVVIVDKEYISEKPYEYEYEYEYYYDYDSEYDYAYDVILQNERVSELGEEYDMLILAELSSPFAAGTVFKWLRNDTYWIILKETEKIVQTHFKGKARQCNHKLKWRREDGSIAFAFGSIKNLRGSGITTDTVGGREILSMPDIDLEAIVPNNEFTQDLKRHSRLIIANKAWEIDNIDDISVPNVLVIRLKEQVRDDSTDDMSENIVVTHITEGSYVSEDYYIKGDLELVWGQLEKYKVLSKDANEQVDIVDFETIVGDNLIDSIAIEDGKLLLTAVEREVGNIEIELTLPTETIILEIKVISLWG